jgi:predicted amidohydrolase
MEDLHVTLIQSKIHWHKVEANLAAFEEKIWEAEKSDIIILPEMFNTGFSIHARPYAERMNGKTFKWMRNMAEQSGAVIIGSYLVIEGSDYFNRLITMHPSGEYACYDKRHLFRMTEEDRNFTAGEKIVIHQIKGWNMNALICYDLRFPVWSRNRFDKNTKTFLYDVLLYIANWPAARIAAWDILLKARAVENMCYVIGVNRVGQDGTNTLYNGHSNIIGPKGEAYEDSKDIEFMKKYTLSAQELIKYREKFPSHLDFDLFKIVN